MNEATSTLTRAGLSRNSEIVVALKSKLITVFSDARRAADMRRTE